MDANIPVMTIRLKYFRPVKFYDTPAIGFPLRKIYTDTEFLLGSSTASISKSMELTTAYSTQTDETDGWGPLNKEDQRLIQAMLNEQSAEIRGDIGAAIAPIVSQSAVLEESVHRLDHTVERFADTVGSFNDVLTSLRLTVAKLDTQMERIDDRIEAGFWRNALIAGGFAAALVGAIAGVLALFLR
jgi:hypothetical protein